MNDPVKPILIVRSPGLSDEEVSQIKHIVKREVGEQYFVLSLNDGGSSRIEFQVLNGIKHIPKEVTLQIKNEKETA